MEVNSEEVAGNGRKEYMPECRSGGCSDRGIRRTMEDAHVCVDDLEEHLGIRGAFYGVSNSSLPDVKSEEISWLNYVLCEIK